MKFSLSWLSELVDIALPAEKLAEFLSLHAFETEIASREQVFENIIVAKVEKIEKHPNADRLRVIILTDGKQTIGPVVCGAWNFDVGATVALALPGATIPHDQHSPEGKPFTLSKATIRGVESQGMICSAKELGLPDEGGGIMLLDSKHKLGETYKVKKDGYEVILDVSVPANRPDLLSYRGVAWEIAALTGKKYKVRPAKSKISKLPARILKVRISEPTLASRYTAIRLTNIQIGSSPKFIQDRLVLSGMRPINNVVDITNYVMLETGQPLHAFDAAKVIGPVNVRTAYVNESISALDDKDYKLDSDMLLIADGKKPLAIAGIIGGADSAVGPNTNEIILESANFNSVAVRKTARQLGIRTESSSRFEKSLPLAFTNIASTFAVELLEKYASAKAAEYATAGTKSEKPAVIRLDTEKVNALLGTKVPANEQKKILTKLGFRMQGANVSAPFWRPDVKVWQDLAEEISRVIGLDKIPEVLTALPPSSKMSDPILDEMEKARDILAGLGFNEFYTYSFISESDLARWGFDNKKAVEIANPLNVDQQYLRPNLAMNIIKLAERNFTESEYQESGKYFEIGNVFWKEQDKILEETFLFMLSFPRTKNRTEELVENLHELGARLGVEFEVRQTEEQLAQIFVANQLAGWVGTTEGVSDIEWIGANIDLAKFLEHKKSVQFKHIARFPTISFDTSIMVREDMPWIVIKKTILDAKQKLLSKINLIESSYQGKEISPGKKAVAFRIVYQAPDRTLTKSEVEDIHGQILNELKSKLYAQIRD